MTGCGIYFYTRPEAKTDGLYGTAETADTMTIKRMSAGKRCSPILTADAYPAGTGECRPAVSSVAGKGGRAAASNRRVWPTAVVQLRTAGQLSSFGWMPSKPTTFRDGRLADRHFNGLTN